jgi:TetR/AcrR family transcriptional regulator
MRKARQPGRPPLKADADLRGKMLDAALRLFSAHGIAPTSLRDIARAADVTPALLHYVFGSKPRLVETVIAERLLPVVGQMRDALQGNQGDSAALIAAFVRAAFALLDRHPWFPPLWAREVLSEGGALRELLIKRIAPMIPQQLARRFGAAQRNGEINPDLDPRLLVVSLIGLTLFPAASAPIWRSIFHAEDIDTETLRLHTIALLDRGVLMAPAAPP